MSSTGARFGRLPVAVNHSGWSRSRLYELAKQYSGLFRKDGAITFVDLELLDQIQASLPSANIGAATKVAGDDDAA
jgi:hypothetical protein